MNLNKKSSAATAWAMGHCDKWLPDAQSIAQFDACSNLHVHVATIIAECKASLSHLWLFHLRKLVFQNTALLSHWCQGVQGQGMECKGTILITLSWQSASYHYSSSVGYMRLHACTVLKGLCPLAIIYSSHKQSWWKIPCSQLYTEENFWRTFNIAWLRE